MSSCLCERRESGREHQGEDKDDTYGIVACGNGSFDGESVKKPDWNHEQSQDDRCDDHGDAGGYAVAVVVVDVLVVGLVSCFLSRDC